MLKKAVQNKVIIWRLFLHHCQLQLKNVKNSKLVRHTLKSRTLELVWFLPIVQIPNDSVVTSSPWSQLLQATLLTIVDGMERKVVTTICCVISQMTLVVDIFLHAFEHPFRSFKEHRQKTIRIRFLFNYAIVLQLHLGQVALIYFRTLRK